MDNLDFETRWLDSQPSAVQVLIHQAERATRLAALKKLGQKVDALNWTRSQRSAFWALWRARRHAVLADTERRLVRVRKAVQKIQRAAAPACASGDMSARVSMSTSPRIDVRRLVEATCEVNHVYRLPHPHGVREADPVSDPATRLGCRARPDRMLTYEAAHGQATVSGPTMKSSLFGRIAGERSEVNALDRNVGQCLAPVIPLHNRRAHRALSSP
jgi:hypothetical protein